MDASALPVVGLVSNATGNYAAPGTTLYYPALPFQQEMIGSIEFFGNQLSVTGSGQCNTLSPPVPVNNLGVATTYDVSSFIPPFSVH